MFLPQSEFSRVDFEGLFEVDIRTRCECYREEFQQGKNERESRDIRLGAKCGGYTENRSNSAI